MKFYCSVENRGDPTTNCNTTMSHTQLQGPRPAALRVSKNSKKVMAKKQNSSPIVVYLISPKIIHVQPEEFMSLVQSLTGNHGQSPQMAHKMVANSRSCSTSSNSGLSQGDEYFKEISRQKVMSNTEN